MDEINKLKSRIKELEDNLSSLCDYLDGLELKTKASFDDFQPSYDEDDDSDDDKDSYSKDSGQDKKEDSNDDSDLI